MGVESDTRNFLAAFFRAAYTSARRFESKSIMKLRLTPSAHCSLLVSAVAALFAAPILRAGSQTWDGGAGTGTAWLTNTNWAGDPLAANIPGSAAVTTNTDIATFAAAGTGNPIGINMNTTGGVYYLGAIELTSASALRNIGNSSATGGVLTLNGATVNSVANTILSNSSANLLTIQKTQSGTMGLALGNTTDNIINITNARAGITISSDITESVAGNKLTKTGTGTLTLSGTNSYTGGTTVSNGALVFLNTAAKATTGTHAFAAGSTLGLGVGGTGFFSATDVTNAFAGTMTGNLSNVTVTSTTNVGIETTAGNFTLATVTGSPTRGLVKTGANTLVLSNNNTFSGGFTLNEGTVEFTPTNGSFTGFGTGTLTINGGTIRTAANANFTTANNSVWNASFRVDRGTTGVRLWNHSGDVVLNNNITVTSASNGWTTNVTGVMSGTGGLTMAGNALTFTLAGANTYSGGTNMGALTLNINNGGSGGTSSALGTGALTLSGGTINNTSGSAVTLSTNNNLNVNGNFTFAGSNALSFGSGLVSLNGTRTFTVSASTLTVGGFAATGAQGFVKAGAGTLVILGNTGTSGNNTLNAGVVNIRNNGSLGSSGGLTLVNSGSALEFQGGLTGVSEALSLNGTGVSNGGALRNISGDNTLTGLSTLFSATRINSDSGTLTFDRATVANAITGSFNLTLGGAGNISVADPIATGTGTLTKDGAGTVTLGATNTFTGATTVSSGTLLVNGSTNASSTVGVSSGATLGGTGTINGAVNVSGVLSPGASIETLGSGTLSFNDGSTLVHELNSTVATSVGSDLLKVTGNLNLTGTVGLTLSDLALTDVAFNVDDVFSIINYTGTWNSGLFTFDGNSLADDSEFTFGLNTWRIDYNAATGGLNYLGEYAGGSDSFVNLTVLTAVPEPSSLALLGTLGAMMLLRRRR